MERTAKRQRDMKQEEKGKKIKAVYEFQQANNGISRKEKNKGEEINNEIIQGKFPELKDTNFQIERAHFNRLKLSYTKPYNCEI